MKKSYNPFKMWGSYIGLAIVYILIVFMSSQQTQYGNHSYLLLILPIMAIFYGAGVFILSLLSFGFFIGWGMHVLVKWNNNKNPLRLRGTYIGASIAFIIFIGWYFMVANAPSVYDFIQAFLWALIFILISSAIGWRIHLLAKRRIK